MKLYKGFRPLNKRRIELCNKEYKSKLTKDEQRELDMLQIVCGAMLQFTHPYPKLPLKERV